MNRHLCALTACLLLVSACDDTAVQLVFHSRLRIPGELDGLCLRVAGNNQVLFSRRHPLAAGDAGHSQSISVVAGEQNPDQFELLLRGELRSRQVSWIRETVRFTEGAVETRDYYIQRCAGKPGGGGFTTGRLTSSAGSVVAGMPVIYATGQVVVAGPGKTQRFAVQQGKVHEMLGPQPVVSSGGKLRRALSVDLDGDCDLDLLVLHRDGPDVWENDGNGQLQKKAGALPVRHDYLAAAAADLDSDGLADLVLVAPKKTTLLLSNTLTPGTLRDASSQLPTSGIDQATSVDIGYVDGDPHPDVVLGRGQSAGAVDSVLYNDASGQAMLSREGVQPTTKTRTTALAVADLTGDGLSELVLGHTNSATEVWTVRQKKLVKIYTVPQSSSGGVLQVLATDLDNDCDVDLVLARAAGVRVLLNSGNDKQGNPTFTEQALGPAALPAHNLAALDITGDGLLDLVLGGDVGGATWLQQRPGDG